MFSPLIYTVIFVYGMNLRHSARIFIEYWICTFSLLPFGESVEVSLFELSFVDRDSSSSLHRYLLLL